MRKKHKAVVRSQEALAAGIYSLWVDTPLAGEAMPGQFVCLYVGDGVHLLPRPISICDMDGLALRLVYRTVGQGTARLAELRPGDTVDILGPLGQGFPLEGHSGRVALLGGGIGIPPMLYLAKALSDRGLEVEAYLGYRGGDLFLSEDFAPYAKVYIATEDGSSGVRGHVLDAMEKKEQEFKNSTGGSPISYSALMACGPMPMLRGVKAYGEQRGVDSYISLEEHMACGVGACLGCVVKTKEIDSHSLVRNARICTEGPVFDARDCEI